LCKMWIVAHVSSRTLSLPCETFSFAAVTRRTWNWLLVDGWTIVSDRAFLASRYRVGRIWDVVPTSRASGLT